MDYQKRIDKLQAALRRKKLDGMLISQPENRRYLSGYRGEDHGIAESSGVLVLPARGQLHLLTDFRYKLQAETDVPWAKVILYPKGLHKLLGKLLPDLGIRRLAYEAHYSLVSRTQELDKQLSKRGIEPVATEGLIEGHRLIKDEQEISLIKASVRLNELVFQQVHQELDSYGREIDLALAIESAMRQRGAERPSFGTIVASGDNSARPHAVPGPGVIDRRRPLTIDMGLVLDGYCSDMTRSFVPAKADGRYLEIHRIVRRAQQAALALIRPGVRCCDVDQAARKVISDAGYGPNFGHSLGHGVGLAVHENPRLSGKSRAKLQTGMVVTVEPGIYLPGWGGIRLEDMVVVTEDGMENLNNDTTSLDL